MAAFVISVERLATEVVALVKKKGLVHMNNHTADSTKCVLKLIVALHSGPPQDPPFFNAFHVCNVGSFKSREMTAKVSKILRVYLRKQSTYPINKLVVNYFDNGI